MPTIAFLSLDPRWALDPLLLADLSRFVEVYFCARVRLVEVPAQPGTQPGWEGLRALLRMPLRSRPGRPGAVAPGQLLQPQLVACLERLQLDARASAAPATEHPGVDVGDCDVLLC